MAGISVETGTGISVGVAERAGAHPVIKSASSKVKIKVFRNNFLSLECFVVTTSVVATRIKIPSMGWGGGEAIRSGYRHPPPFRESVVNRSVAGDLTSLVFSSAGLLVY